MNILDILLVLILVFAIRSGIIKGFIFGLIELITWLGSLVLCFLIYPFISGLLSKQLSPNDILLFPLSFLITIVLIRHLFMLLPGQFFSVIPRSYQESRINKTLGALPGFVNGLVYNIILILFLVLFPVGNPIKLQLQESSLAGILTPGIEKMQEKLSGIIEEFREKSVGTILVEPDDQELIRLGFTVNNARVRTDLEAEMLGLINKERQKEGLPPLKADTALARVARLHSKDMFARGYFSHYTPEKKDPFDRMRAQNISFIAAGENLALAPTLKIAHKNLMDSPGHRANILQHSFHRVGIGVLDGGIHGLMITQNFRN